MGQGLPRDPELAGRLEKPENPESCKETVQSCVLSQHICSRTHSSGREGGIEDVALLRLSDHSHGSAELVLVDPAVIVFIHATPVAINIRIIPTIIIYFCWIIKAVHLSKKIPKGGGRGHKWTKRSNHINVRSVC